MRRYLARTAAVAAVLAALQSGCAIGGELPRDRSARLIVTADFGARRLGEARVTRATDHPSALDLLAAVRRVERADSRVVAVDGRRAGPDREWAPLVNGVDPRPGLPAAEGREDRLPRTLSPGDLVQWDLRASGVRAGAVVGAFPRPFVGGTSGRRFPVRIECDAPEAAGCRRARERLAARGVPVSVGALGSEGGPTLLRVVVAPWPLARRLRSLLVLEGDPRGTGVFARFEDGGRRLALLDASGRATAAPPATGIVAALRSGRDAPTWVITGTDAAGVEAAAGALGERELRDRYAVAATPSGVLGLPLESTR